MRFVAGAAFFSIARVRKRVGKQGEGTLAREPCVKQQKVKVGGNHLATGVKGL